MISRLTAYGELSISCLLLPAMIFVAGCDPPPIDKTSSTDSLLVAVLADLYLEEAEVQLAATLIPDSLRITQDVSDPRQILRRDSIYAVHGLTDEQFSVHMAQYVEQPEELQLLYERVLDRLNLERQQVQEP
jgi:hypothetical protein